MSVCVCVCVCVHVCTRARVFLAQLSYLPAHAPQASKQHQDALEQELLAIKGAHGATGHADRSMGRGELFKHS